MKTDLGLIGSGATLAAWLCRERRILLSVAGIGRELALAAHVAPTCVAAAEAAAAGTASSRVIHGLASPEGAVGRGWTAGSLVPAERVA